MSAPGSDRGSDVGSAPGPENQQFFAAVARGDLTAVRALLAAHPDVLHARDERGTSPILLAVYSNRKDVAACLRDAGADVGIFEASALGDKDLVKQLVASDPALVNAFAPDGFQPLGLACFFRHAGVARYLLAHGADPSTASRNAQQVTPLHSAVAVNDVEITTALVEAGSNVTLSQQGGYTPLHEAAHNGNRAIAELLLAHGADVRARTHKGETPSDIARGRGFGPLADLLDGRPGPGSASSSGQA